MQEIIITKANKENAKHQNEHPIMSISKKLSLVGSRVINVMYLYIPFRL